MTDLSECQASEQKRGVGGAKGVFEPPNIPMRTHLSPFIELCKYVGFKISFYMELHGFYQRMHTPQRRDTAKILYSGLLTVNILNRTSEMSQVSCTT